MGEVAKELEQGRVRFVKAQVAIAIDVVLALPLRPQNLCSLNWQHNFSEPMPKGSAAPSRCRPKHQDQATGHCE
jgi:hypothetical protein